MTDIECVCVENSVPLPCVFIENLVACRARVHDVYILKSNALYVLTQCEYTQTHTHTGTHKLLASEVVIFAVTPKENHLFSTAMSCVCCVRVYIHKQKCSKKKERRRSWARFTHKWLRQYCALTWEMVLVCECECIWLFYMCVNFAKSTFGASIGIRLPFAHQRMSA